MKSLVTYFRKEAQPIMASIVPLRGGVRVLAIMIFLNFAFFVHIRPSDAKIQTAAPKIFGADDRRIVTDTRILPWSAVGHIKSSFDKVSYTGTGVLIGNKTVLTVAHNVFDQKLGWATEIVFTPGKNGETEPFGRAKAVKMIPRDEWINSGTETCDIAILVLDSPIGENAGFFKIVVRPSSFFDDLTLHAAGYPGDLIFGFMYSAVGKAVAATGNELHYTIDSEPGQSGSPIWYIDSTDNSNCLVGLMKGAITAGDGITEIDNIGIRITQEFANWIDRTLSENEDTPQNITAPVPLVESAACGALGLETALILTLFCTTQNFLKFKIR